MSLGIFIVSATLMWLVCGTPKVDHNPHTHTAYIIEEGQMIMIDTITHEVEIKTINKGKLTIPNNLIK